MAVIYHGTPLTPRAALLEVCAGRAMCVSFFRPDDVEAVETISPDIMFRQRCIFHVESCAAARRRLGRKMGLDGLFRVARAALIHPRKVGCCARYARSAKPAQRCAYKRLAVWTKGCTAVAHGRTNRTAHPPLREMGSRLPWLDRRGEAPRQARISQENAPSRSGARQPLASDTHDAGHQSCFRLPLCKRGRNDTRSKRVAL